MVPRVGCRILLAAVLMAAVLFLTLHGSASCLAWDNVGRQQWAQPVHLAQRVATNAGSKVPDSSTTTSQRVGKRTNDDRRGARPMNPDFSGSAGGADPMRSDGG